MNVPPTLSDAATPWREKKADALAAADDWGREAAAGGEMSTGVIEEADENCRAGEMLLAEMAGDLGAAEKILSMRLDAAGEMDA